MCTLLRLWLGQLCIGFGLAVSLDILLELHASVLEPDLNLPLAQRQPLGDLDSSRPVQIHVALELVFELHKLDTGEGCTGSLQLHPVRVLAGLRGKIFIRGHLLVVLLLGGVIVDGGGIGVHLVVVRRQADGTRSMMVVAVE